MNFRLYSFTIYIKPTLRFAMLPLFRFAAKLCGKPLSDFFAEWLYTAFSGEYLCILRSGSLNKIIFFSSGFVNYNVVFRFCSNRTSDADIVCGIFCF